MTYGQAKQSFGTCDDAGSAEGALHLPPEEMEVLCRRRRECDVHVHIRGRVGHLVRVVGELRKGTLRCEKLHVHIQNTDLQHTLNPRGRVFRAGAIKTEPNR